jgi:hypothetical protein
MRMPKRLFLGLLASALLSVALPVRAAEVERLLPEKTETILVINVKQLLESPLIKKHALELARGALKQNEQVSKIFEALGFDPFRDVTSVTVATTGAGPDAKGLAIVHGQFDTAKFHAKAEEVSKEQGEHLKIHKEGGNTIYEVQSQSGQEPMFVGIVDKSTIVGSNKKDEVTTALSKAGGNTAATNINKDLQALVEKADANQSLWFAMIASALKGQTELANEEKFKKIIEKLTSISGAINVTDGLSIHATVATKSADDAKELADEAKQGLEQASGFLALLVSQNQKLAPVEELAKSLKVSAEKSSVEIKGGLSGDKIEKSLKPD